MNQSHKDAAAAAIKYNWWWRNPVKEKHYRCEGGRAVWFYEAEKRLVDQKKRQRTNTNYRFGKPFPELSKKMRERVFSIWNHQSWIEGLLGPIRDCLIDPDTSAPLVKYKIMDKDDPSYDGDDWYPDAALVAHNSKLPEQRARASFFLTLDLRYTNKEILEKFSEVLNSERGKRGLSDSGRGRRVGPQHKSFPWAEIENFDLHHFEPKLTTGDFARLENKQKDVLDSALASLRMGSLRMKERYYRESGSSTLPELRQPDERSDELLIDWI